MLLQLEVDFDLADVPTEMWAIYVPHVFMNVALYAGREPIGNSAGSISREQMNEHCFKGRADRLRIRSLRLGGMMLARV